MHFLNQKKPLVGAVTYYNPSSAEGAEQVREMLASAQEKITMEI